MRKIVKAGTIFAIVLFIWLGMGSAAFEDAFVDGVDNDGSPVNWTRFDNDGDTEWTTSTGVNGESIDITINGTTDWRYDQADKNPAGGDFINISSVESESRNVTIAANWTGVEDTFKRGVFMMESNTASEAGISCVVNHVGDVEASDDSGNFNGGTFYDEGDWMMLRLVYHPPSNDWWCQFDDQDDAEGFTTAVTDNDPGNHTILGFGAGFSGGTSDGVGTVRFHRVNGTEDAPVGQSTTPTITFNSPSNASTSDTSPTLNATIDDDGAWAQSTAFLDGNILVEDFNSTVPYNLVNTTSGLSEGKHNYTVQATDSAGQNTTSSRFFTVDTTAPVINITKPIGEVISNTTNTFEFNFTRTDATSTIDICVFNPNNGTGNITQTTCQNTTVTYTTVGAHTVDLWVNDTAGNTAKDSQDFTTDLENTVTANDSETGSTVNSFTVTFSNGTSSFDFTASTTDGSLEAVTSDLPTGNAVTLTVEATGYNDGSTTADINETRTFSVNVELDPVSVSYEIFDESTQNYIVNPGFVTANNGTHEEKYGVLNKLNTEDTVDIGSAGAAFDRNLNSATTSGLDTSGDRLVGYVALEQVSDNNLSVRGTQGSGADGDLQLFNDDTQTWDTVSSSPFDIGGGTTTKSFTVNNSDGRYDSGQVRITGGNTQATVNEIWSGDISVIDVPTDEVLLGNVTLKVDDVNSDDLDDYRSRTFFVEITDTDRNIHTYLLNRADGIQASVKTVNELGEAIVGARVTLTREFGFTTVTVAQRDTVSGGTATFFVDPDETYGLNATADDHESFSGTFNGQPYQFTPLEITLDSLEEVEVAISRFEVLSVYTFSCTESTTSFNCTFNHSNSGIQSTNLTVRQQLPIGTNTVCDVGSTLGDGTLTCTGLNTTANTYNFVLFSVTTNGDEVTLDTGTLSTPSNDYGAFGLFAFFIFLVTLAFAGLWQPEAAILLAVLAVPLGFFTGILAIDETAVISIIAVAGILLWRLRR